MWPTFSRAELSFFFDFLEEICEPSYGKMNDAWFFRIFSFLKKWKKKISFFNHNRVQLFFRKIWEKCDFWWFLWLFSVEITKIWHWKKWHFWGGKPPWGRVIFFFDKFAKIKFTSILREIWKWGKKSGQFWRWPPSGFYGWRMQIFTFFFWSYGAKPAFFL